jgi:hypothetical protein
MSRPARITQRQVPQHIAALQPFVASSLVGHGFAPYGCGRLTGDERDMYREVQPDCDYVVLSYSTPIAWHHPRYGWRVVESKFSATTGRHQSLVRRGLATHAIEVAQQQTSMATAADAAAVVDGEA